MIQQKRERQWPTHAVTKILQKWNQVHEIFLLWSFPSDDFADVRARRCEPSAADGLRNRFSANREKHQQLDHNLRLPILSDMSGNRIFIFLLADGSDCYESHVLDGRLGDSAS